MLRWALDVCSHFLRFILPSSFSYLTLLQYIEAQHGGIFVAFLTYCSLSGRQMFSDPIVSDMPTTPGSLFLAHIFGFVPQGVRLWLFLWSSNQNKAGGKTTIFITWSIPGAFQCFHSTFMSLRFIFNSKLVLEVEGILGSDTRRPQHKSEPYWAGKLTEGGGSQMTILI